MAKKEVAAGRKSGEMKQQDRAGGRTMPLTLMERCPQRITSKHCCGMLSSHPIPKQGHHRLRGRQGTGNKRVKWPVVSHTALIVHTLNRFRYH